MDERSEEEMSRGKAIADISNNSLQGFTLQEYINVAHSQSQSFNLRSSSALIS